MKEKLHVDLTPIHNFQYCQISNFNFQYLLLDENMKALHSPFQCKDYLQDIFYCEYTNRSGGIWGIHWQPGRVNTNVKTFHLALMWLNADMTQRIKPLKKFIHVFEKSLGIKPKSKIHETDNNGIIVVEFSKEWTNNGPLLSAFTTLLRISGAYSDGDPLEYLKELKAPATLVPDYMKVDVNRLRKGTMLERFAALLQGLRPEHNWADFANMNYVHDTGIVGFNKFPEVEV